MGEHILVVDDDTEIIRLVQAALEGAGYQVTALSSGGQALTFLQNRQPDLVLLDRMMPGLDGLETLRRLRQKDGYVSVIFLTGQSAYEEIVSGLDAGADDYIIKPFSPDILLARVRAQLRVKRVQDELLAANMQLQTLVDIDDLTGLYNMRSLYDKLDQEIRRAERHQRRVAVIMMDMDNFKSVNDDHDHLFGSFVLSEVGRIIREHIRRFDFAARYGGDEFLIVLTEIDKDGAFIFAERLRETISNHIFASDGSVRQMTVSLGFAITPKGVHNIDARELVRTADHALYEAKDSGRNRTHFIDLSELRPVQRQV